MAQRFLIGFKSRLFPDYVPLSQKKAKLEPHHSWVLLAVWAGALSCWKIGSDMFCNNFLLKTFKFFFMYLCMVQWYAGWPAAGNLQVSFLVDWLFSPNFLAMTILAVLERIDRRSPPHLLSMDSTFLFWRHQFWMVLIRMCSAWYRSFWVEPPSSMHFNGQTSVLPHLSDIAFRLDWRLKILGQYFCNESAALEIFLAKAWTLHWTCAWLTSSRLVINFTGFRQL